MTTPKTTITITYRHAGTQPPIFVAGEFSDPPWEPQEMDFTTDEDGEHTFKKDILAYAGSKVQYKFRVGLGDWWVLNEAAPTAVDSAGIPNNVAEVPANAARELMNRTEPHSESGASTPSFVRTAAEVADTAALLDKDDELQSDTEPPVANAAKELLNRAEPQSRSGASTPSFVKTTVEVADSAALLDKEEPEEEVTDEEAGRIGYRRLSTTPIPDVAVTAAEVADTAQQLDADVSFDQDSIPQNELRPAEYNAIDPYGFNDPFASDSKAPLFAHECVGMTMPEEDQVSEAHEDQDDDVYNDDEPSPDHGSEYDPDNIDPNDPTLERFPSNREEIIDAVRKLEGGLNEDQSDVEGLVPPSPIVGPTGPQKHDILGDFLVSSPVVASPIAGRGSRLLGLPGRSSLGSVSSDRLSAASLGSISEAEEEETGDDDEPQVPVILTPKPGKHRSKDDVTSPTREDDEGIVMRSGDDKPRGGSPIDDPEPQASGADSSSSDPIGKTQTERDAPSSAAKPPIELEEASDNSGTQTPAPRAPEKAGKQNKQLPFQRTDRTTRSVAANAWAAAVQAKDVTTNKEMMAHREAQDQELQAQGLNPEDVQAPIKDTWRPTKLDDDGRRKNEKAQQTYHATKAPGGNKPSEPPISPTEHQPASDDGQTASPDIVFQTAEETGQSSKSPSQTSDDNAGEDAATATAKSTGVDTGAQSQLKKRTAGPQRTGTPVSIHETGIKAAESGNWFRSFFRMIFVDWIGGLISNLFGGKRDTYLAAGAAAALVGVTWWRSAGKFGKR